MKHRFFTLLLAVMASVGISSAAITVRLNPESCAGWSSVHLWAWYANGNVFDKWPGPEIYTDADGWYSYTFDASISLVNIIWNDGSSNQTVDITNITQSTCYALSRTTGTSISVRVVDCPAYYLGATTISNFLQMKDTKHAYQLQGVVTNLYPLRDCFELTDWTGSLCVGCHIVNADNSMTFFGNTVQVGDTITLQGSYDSDGYFGIRVKDVELVEYKPFEQPAQFMGEVNIGLFINIADTKNIYQLTGIVSEINYYAYEYGVFTLEDKTGSIHIEGLYDMDGQTRAFNKYSIKEKDTITLTGTYSWDYQPQIADAILVEHKPYVEPPVLEPILSGQCGENLYFRIDTTTMALIFNGVGDQWYQLEDIWVRFPVPGEDYYAHHEGGAYASSDYETGRIGVSLYEFMREWCTSIEIASDKIYPLDLDDKYFRGKEIESYVIAQGNAYYSSEDGVLFDKDKEVLLIYPEHKENAAYHIPNTVKRIETQAFGGNPFITSVTMGNNVEVIGMAAFVQCASLNSITLSENLSFIGYSLLELTPYYDNEANWDNGSLYIGNYLIEVARICMREATSYQNDQGEWVTETTDCPPVEIDSNYVVKEGTRLIAMFAGASDEFGDPNRLKKVTIPASVEYVNFGAFMDNYALEEIVWNAKHCHDFEKTIPYCGYCADMTIENPFAQFADGAFEMEQEGGTQPTEMPTKKISFGKGVEYIPAGFCKDMKLLETVYNYNPDPIAVSADMFANVPYTCILYVPFGCRAKYENAPVWKDFFRIREMDQDEAIEDIYFKDATPHKVMVNGQIFIFRGDKTYTVQGQEVK